MSLHLAYMSLHLAYMLHLFWNGSHKIKFNSPLHVNIHFIPDFHANKIRCIFHMTPHCFRKSADCSFTCDSVPAIYCICSSLQFAPYFWQRVVFYVHHPLGCLLRPSDRPILISRIVYKHLSGNQKCMNNNLYSSHKCALFQNIFIFSIFV